ncbi:hypothetical protein [Pyrobaculum sp.]|uniref:hypothetical protein n=1 Tax=Pyrobaculum sp. TaxID=2004705 RepID=UPI003D130F05
MSDRYTVGRTSRGMLVYRCRFEEYESLNTCTYEEMKKYGLLKVVRGDVEYEPWNFDFGDFKPVCIPSVKTGGGFTRWWFRYGIFAREDFRGVLYMKLSNIAISENYTVDRVDLNSKCRYPAGAGSLTGAELPVVRRKDGYLRVGSWLAWHRVLGTLDDGRWVLIGDDGLYEAVFTPTVKDPLEVFGEVGYVRVVGPYVGDVDLVQSPCGAPRLVACSEEGVKVARALLGYVRGVLAGWGVVSDLFVPSSWSCSRPFVIPELAELDIPNWVVLDWPLADPCPPVLLAMSQDPLGLLTDATCHTCWD